MDTSINQPEDFAADAVAQVQAPVDSAMHRASSQAGLASFHPGDVDEGPLPQRVPGSTFGVADVAQVIVNRESIRAAYEAQGGAR